MYVRIGAGVIVGILFLFGSYGESPTWFAGVLGSTFGLLLYLRLRRAATGNSSLKLWLASLGGTIGGGLIRILLASSPDGAKAVTELIGASFVMAIPMAAAFQLVLSGLALMRRCPHCAERIRHEATVCRYCGGSAAASGPGSAA